MSDRVDVVVTDGFTGNVVLKTLEGGLKAIVNALLAAFESEDHYKPHAEALLPALVPLYETLDPDTYGGAILLGVDGVCTISHGSTGARAMANGIRVAKEMVEHGIVEEIRAGGERVRCLSSITDRCLRRPTSNRARSGAKRSSRSSATGWPTSSRSTHRRSARASRSSTTSMPTRWP